MAESSHALHIPDEALRLMRGFTRGNYYPSDAAVAEDVRMVAAPVVAAELRRLAHVLTQRPTFMVIHVLQTRADELTGGGE